MFIVVVAGSLACGDATGPSGLQGPRNLWRPNPSSVPATGNYLVIESEQGDVIGGGVPKVYQSPTDTIAVTWRDDEDRLTFVAGSRLEGQPSPLHFFIGDFVGPSGMNPLVIGYYGGLERFPFHDPTKGGLAVDGYGYGCNTLTGWFTVDAISYSGSTVTSLDLRFEQHCDGDVPALHGAIHWRL